MARAPSEPGIECEAQYPPAAALVYLSGAMAEQGSKHSSPAMPGRSDASEVRAAAGPPYVPPPPRVPKELEASDTDDAARPPRPGHVGRALPDPEGDVEPRSGIERRPNASPRARDAAPLARPDAGVAAPKPKPPAPAETSPTDAAGHDAAGEDEPFGDRKSLEIELPIGFGDPTTGDRFVPPEPIARFGRYDILGRLATGGMAEIFLAQEPFEGGGRRPVIVKVLRKQLAKEEDFEVLFLREGRVAMQLAHPHICNVFEFGKWGGHFFIAMEYIEGATLKGLLERLAKTDEPLPAPIAVGIAAKVAAALDYAHHAKDANRRDLGVVHRDISPHNIMVRFDGVVKLLDFGVAKVAQSEDESRSEAVKGKLGYLAPEQCLTAPVDGRTDIFALGICLWEALTGRRLYKRGGQYEIFRAILEEPPPSIRAVRPDLPEELDAIVLKALAKAPADRYQSAVEFQEALEGWLAARGEVVTASALRRLMHGLFAHEVAHGVSLEVDAKVADRLRPTSIHPPRSTSDRPPPPDTVETLPPPSSRPSRRGVALVALAVVTVTVAIVAALATRAPAPTALDEPAAGEPHELASSEPEAPEPLEPEPAETAATPDEPDPSAQGAEGAAAEPATEPTATEPTAAEPDVGAPSVSGDAARPAGVAPSSSMRPSSMRERPGFVADPGF